MTSDAQLPPHVANALAAFTKASRHALGEDLRSVVLFGSAADGRLRATSDVNVILVLRRFDPPAVAGLRQALRVAQAAIDLRPMFLLETEIEAAANAFANKFADVLRRRRVLFGADPFATVSIPVGAKIARLQQVLLNLTLRMRAAYAMRGLREEQLALVVAEESGPLRAAAATLLDVEGSGAPPPPKEALERVVGNFGDPMLSEALRRVSEARETRRLAPGVAAPTLLALIDIAERMRRGLGEIEAR